MLTFFNFLETFIKLLKRNKKGSLSSYFNLLLCILNINSNLILCRYLFKYFLFSFKYLDYLD